MVAETKSTVLIMARPVREGTDRPRDSPPERPARDAARQGQLRGDPGAPARVRAVRLRARRLHRRNDEQEGQVRAGRRRHHLLDEIGTMSPALQAKLPARAAGARVRAARRRASQRVTCGHRRDQPRSPSDGGRRPVLEDLYYRLNVIPLEIPRSASARKTSPCSSSISSGSTRSAPRRSSSGSRPRRSRRWQAYDWPGNVRELENTLERAVVLSRAPIIDRTMLLMPGGTGRRHPPCPPSTAPESRMDRARDHPPSARRGRRGQEGRRRSHGHQPARSQLLPGQIPRRLVAFTRRNLFRTL